MASLRSSALSSSFHGTSILPSRLQNSAQFNIRGCQIACSIQSRNRFAPRAPLSKRHISSKLASSLQMQTPQGEALLAMTNLRLPSDLISQAAAQQLELLAAEAEAEATLSSRDDDVRAVEGQEGVLLRRIAEVKEKETAKALQDIVLALVTLRLVRATSSDATVALQGASSLDDRLRSVHPPDVQPLINRHVAMVLNGKDQPELPFEPTALAGVGKLELGKLYAASVMHGYFLARVHQRFKLDRVLQLEGVSMEPREEPDCMGAYLDDKEALHNFSSISCLHTLQVMERHCQALFGEARLHAHRNPCHANTSFFTIQVGSIRSLILQALAFGALLWDVETNFISPIFHFN